MSEHFITKCSCGEVIMQCKSHGLSTVEFLRKLRSHQIVWNYDNLKTVKRLSEEGLTEYIKDMYSGQWHVSEKGNKLL